jgi:hypothetical protein
VPEDGQLSDIRNVRGAEGRIEISAAALEAREDAMVRAILDSGKPVAVLVLGGAHDLTGNAD